jgi:hypothetical protein
MTAPTPVCGGAGGSTEKQGVAPFIASPPLVVERDDGFWSIGWHDDAPGPFESRAFAEAVRLGTRHQARWLEQ